jgi:hypothetical protein
LCKELKQSLSDDGVAIFKSASIRPWYVSIFHKHGFKLERVGSHETNDIYDRVNMYASVWRVKQAKKLQTDNILTYLSSRIYDHVYMGSFVQSSRRRFLLRTIVKFVRSCVDVFVLLMRRLYEQKEQSEILVVV